MGIVTAVLAEFELKDGRSCVIELNENGEIHVHIGLLRIDMTPTEFRQFADTIVAAQDELHDKKAWN